MDTKTREQDVTDRPQLTLIEHVLSLSELCAHVRGEAREGRLPGRPTPQWSRIEAGRSDDLGASGTATDDQHCH